MPMKHGPESAGTGRVKFQFPPITELVIGVHFPPILELKSQHIGMYWELIRERFPICEQQLPQMQMQQVAGRSDQLVFPPTVPGEIFPLQRFWFRSDTSPLLIQIQRDTFWLNWRRLLDGDYPHFETVEGDFWREFEVFRKFVQSIGGILDVPLLCDLTYVNLIGPNQFVSGSLDFGKVLPAIASFRETNTDGHKLMGLNTIATYMLSESLLVDVSAKLGKKIDTDEQALLFELKAHGILNDRSFEGAKEWLRAAHEGTYRLFLDLTDEEIQREVWRHR
jgi:uncharacterized protein (TIGR04255 family)